MADAGSPETSLVIHNQAEQRFELCLGDELCRLDYRRSPGKMVIYHTEVPKSFQHRGLAARMTRAALEFARAEKLQVDPRCPYTAAFLQKHREYDNLLASR